MTPDFLVVGHIVKDITTSGWRPGGSVYYAAAQARRLGLGVAAVTSCASDLDPPAILADIHWRVVPSAQTTTFENRYADARRTQRVLARAMPLCLEDIPHDWRAAPTVLLGPVFHDVDASLPALLTRPGALVGLGAQGWLRSLEDDHVKPGRVEPDAPWLAGDVLFVSDEDVEDAGAVGAWSRRLPIVVLTRGRGGCTVWAGPSRLDLPAYDIDEIDATGAGDVFAAAFLIRYQETADAGIAARFASAAAALSLRGEGVSAIAVRPEIDALLYRRPVAKVWA